jgi:DNA repair protein RadC
VKKYKGVGEAKAINIIAALELGRRRQDTDPLQRSTIKSSKDAFNILYPLVADLPHEEFWILLCNRANKVIHSLSIGRGGVASVVVDVKIILKSALEHLASSIVLCHNHPSGNLKPSNEDIKITKRLQEAGALLDITVIDHLIIGDMHYYSFADEGIL